MSVSSRFKLPVLKMEAVCSYESVLSTYRAVSLSGSYRWSIAIDQLVAWRMAARRAAKNIIE
jgi:hypothetical protein